MNPKYPVYVISKGRSHVRLTTRELNRMKVPYSLVVEPVDRKDYEGMAENIITLPFSDLGQGSIPARNFVWDHAVSNGHKKHWILDDNIEGFHRLHQNMKPKVTSGTIFKIAEDFTDRYTNVGLSGFNYYSFCKNTDAVPPFYLNTRIYSCILVNHAIGFKWRGRYNEDTDLSLRCLKAGWCTILFNVFLAGKVTTMRMKGGNTDNVYTDGDNRRKFAEALQTLHPDVVKVVWKFNRWHHKVDYKGFTQQLKKKNNLPAFKPVDNYGLKLIDTNLKASE